MSLRVWPFGGAPTLDTGKSTTAATKIAAAVGRFEGGTPRAPRAGTLSPTLPFTHNTRTPRARPGIHTHPPLTHAPVPLSLPRRVLVRCVRALQASFPLEKPGRADAPSTLSPPDTSARAHLSHNEQARRRVRFLFCFWTWARERPASCLTARLGATARRWAAGPPVLWSPHARRVRVFFPSQLRNQTVFARLCGRAVPSARPAARVWSHMGGAGR